MAAMCFDPLGRVPCEPPLPREPVDLGDAAFGCTAWGEDSDLGEQEFECEFEDWQIECVLGWRVCLVVLGGQMK